MVALFNRIWVYTKHVTGRARPTSFIQVPLPSAPTSGLRVVYCLQHDLFVRGRKNTYEKVRTRVRHTRLYLSSSIYFSKDLSQCGIGRKIEGGLVDHWACGNLTLLASRVRTSGSALSNASRF